MRRNVGTRHRAVTAWGGIEELESRILLASNVVSISFPFAGGIALTGDKVANHVILSENAQNDLIIQGDEGTVLKFKGEPASQFSQQSDTQVTGLHVLANPLSISANMVAGDDFLEAQNLGSNLSSSPANLTVDMGTGNDVLGISNCVLIGLLINATGRGASATEVDMESTEIKGATTINLGKTTTADLINLIDSDFAGAVQIATGKGADELDVSGSTLEHMFSANLGAGDDSISLEGQNVFLGVFSVNGGKGNNVFTDDATSDFTGERILSFGTVERGLS